MFDRLVILCATTVFLFVSPAFAQGAPAAPTPPAAGQGVTPQRAQPGRLPEQVQSLVDRARAPYDQALALFTKGGKDNLEAGIPLLREALTLLDAAVLVAGNIPEASQVVEIRDAVRQLLAEKEATAKEDSSKASSASQPSSIAQPASESDRRALYARVVNEIDASLTNVGSKPKRLLKSTGTPGTRSNQTILEEIRGLFAIPGDKALESLNRVDEHVLDDAWGRLAQAWQAPPTEQGVLARRQEAAAAYLTLSWLRLAKRPELTDIWARRARASLLIGDDAKAWQAGRALNFLKAGEGDPSDDVVKALTELELVGLHNAVAGAVLQHLSRKTVELAPGVTAEFVYIDAPAVAPDGFMMGSPIGEKGRLSDEAQIRAVLTKGYWMQTTEVTVEQFGAFVAATGHRTDAEQEGTGRGFSNEGHTNLPGLNWRNPGLLGRMQSSNEPVVQVSWNDASSMTTWLRQRGIAARLPTEAEWEFACRAGTITAYWWGNDLARGQGAGNFADEAYERFLKRFGRTFADRVKWDDGAETTSRVGGYRSNAWGFHDMCGNVLEWCQDWYGGYPSGRPTNPTGTQAGTHRVVRGGSWASGPDRLRSASRMRSSPSSRSDAIGFRLALDSE